jgi:predicted ferric reductase
MIISVFFYFLLPLAQAVIFIRAVSQLGMWGGFPELINLLTSVFAYHLLQANLILGAKVPWFQKGIPYDKRILLHIYGSAGIAAAVMYHGLYKLIMGFYLGPVTLILAAAVIGILILSILWIPLPGFRKIRSLLTPKGLSYDRFKGIHVILALALSLLILIHVVSAGSYAMLPFPSRLGYPLLFLLGTGLLLLSKTNLPAEMVTVEEVQEQEGIITITLKGSRKARKAGQFAFLRIPGKGSPTREHPFSYLNDGEGTETRFAARHVGPFTGELARLRKGDTLVMRGGFGNFRPAGKAPVCLIGSGIGIVPLISLMEEWDRAKEVRSAEVFLSVNSREEIPRYEDVLTMAEKNGNMTLHLSVYKEDGRLFDSEYFEERLGDPGEYSYYICSSPGVRNIVVKILTSLGVRKGAIHFEAFSFA